MARLAVAVGALLVLAACDVRGSGPEPPAGQILFTVNRAGWGEIWVMDASGERRRRLTPPAPSGTDAAGNTDPRWSPDGASIAYVSTGAARREDAEDQELYVMRADGSGKRRLTRNAAPDWDPTWAPGGDRIAVARALNWGTDRVRGVIATVHLAGRETQLVNDRGRADPTVISDVAWSPDGRRIAFTRSTVGEEGFESAIYVVGADGTGERRLFQRAQQPAWSPDGKRIAFASTRDRNGRTCFQECSPSPEIYVADANGGEPTRLTDSAADDGAPAWSPDGDWIVFASDRSNPRAHEYELWLLPADGGDPRRLTENDVWDVDPSWRPATPGRPS